MTLYELILAMVATALIPNVLAVGYHHTYKMVKIGFGIAWALVVSACVCFWIYGALAFHMGNNTFYIVGLIIAIILNSSSASTAANSPYERPRVVSPSPVEGEKA